ncbi:DUF2083 domain-containing protein [Streptomyces sp. ISL-98]|nr:DUF2083 domain-containing protein [Streptomyces sp. ISL-98]
MPIGMGCRLCERTDCPQRAVPPPDRRPAIDENNSTFVPLPRGRRAGGHRLTGIAPLGATYLSRRADAGPPRGTYPRNPHARVRFPAGRHRFYPSAAGVPRDPHHVGTVRAGRGASTCPAGPNGSYAPPG